MRGIRKLLALLLCVCLLLPCVTVGTYAETTASGTCGDNLTWELDDQGTLTVSGTGPMSDYSVDDAPWYENRDQITRVVIQEGVTTVGHCAFEDCAVETVSLPDSLTALEIGAFYSCTHLDSVDIPAGVTSIAHNAFGYSTVTALNVDPANAVYASADGVLFSKDGTTLVTYPAGRPDTSYTIPAGVTAIGESAFYTNRYLTELVIPEGVTTLGPSALRDFRSLPEINLPASISTIGEWALSESRFVTAVNCSENNPDFSSLDGVLFSKDQTRLIVYPAGRPADSYAIPDGVTSIANAAFNTAALLKTVTMPDSVTVLGKNVFSGSRKLEQVTLSANLTEIPWHTFSRCEKLGSIVIPEGVTLIDSFAFRSCSVLADVTIPASVTEIRANAFSVCSALADVYYGGAEAQWNQIQIAAAGNARLIVATIHYNGEGPVVDEIAIDETHFPDANFRSYVAENFDTDGNGALSTAEIAQVDEINVSERDITSLKGVEYFTALKWLYCCNNQLTTLDVSANTALVDLECGDNQLTSLDVSRNTELTGLCCENNQLTALDISRNTKLLGLDCSNNRLASLDASKCPDIVRLYCSNNQLTMLDVSSNGSLMYLYCQNNRLASLSLSGSPSMWQLSCYGNSIAELDISACLYLLGAYVYGDTYETEVYREYESEGGESMYIDLTTVVTGVPHTGPEITGQPQDYTGAVGETANFTVEAQGEGLTYQWQYKSLKDGKWYTTTTTGYNTPTMSIAVTNNRNGMQFRCKVTDGSGDVVYSNAAAIHVGAALAITGQPTDFTGPVGATATFTVVATGTGL
ncbi:MAG: leucine-rich repeat protein, partial [Oscillospiraceae bacterium]|nr:leucine-rich repeat protein [Oscillospiraceae bacterium]